MVTYCYAQKFLDVSILEQIEKFNKYKYNKIWVESDIENNSKQLEEMLKECAVQKKSSKQVSVIITNLAVFGRTLFQLNEIFNFFDTYQIRLISIDEGIDTKENRDVYHIYKALVQVQKNMINQSIKEGIEKRRATGVKLGRPTASNKSIEKAVSLYQKGHTYRYIASQCSLSVGTVHKYIEMYKKDYLNETNNPE